MAQTPAVLHFSGHHYLRHRLVLSILSGKPVRIDKIRSDDQNPGLRDYEVSLLRLLERVTNGTVIEISVTGTAILLKPGIIAGGSVTHECPLSRSVGYFLEPVIMLAPFAKKPLSLTLKGITTDEHDLSVDIIRTVTLPHLQLFGVSDGLELRIKKRGSAPLGGGEVQFLCPIVKQVKTLDFVDPGRIKRIRGISSPGYALSLLAESTTGAMHSAEAISKPGVPPEEIALLAARSLLAEIRRGGAVDRHHQSLVLLMMVLGSEDVGRCRLGEPTARTIQFLRDMKQAFGTAFKIAPADPSDPESTDLIFSCYGVGYINANRTLS
ncbi:hypothetical protein BN946_scf185002.g107 [Trametes cinnabarina]|uniref:RNA 3'-terminal phosphate cyclase domain-containing protein n=1 Tax=Pycnoporus cinnabarinus TaxID=5643 RepID=A0A060SEJ4_PYCCI|nr:hypothetical protein BN946_scf185002.g107 [Trametes cinnabarina]